MSIKLKGKENELSYYGRYASLDNSNSNSFHYDKEYIGDKIVYEGHFMYYGCRIEDRFDYYLLDRTGEGSNTAFGKYTMKKESKDNSCFTEFIRSHKKKKYDGNDTKEFKKVCFDEEKKLSTMEMITNLDFITHLEILDRIKSEDVVLDALNISSKKIFNLILLLKEENVSNKLIIMNWNYEKTELKQFMKSNNILLEN